MKHTIILTLALCLVLVLVCGCTPDEKDAQTQAPSLPAISGQENGLPDGGRPA